MKRKEPERRDNSSDAMEISIKTVNGKIINLEVDGTSETIDLKIHGPTRQLALRLGPDLDSDSGQEAIIMRIFVAARKRKPFNLEVKETETIADVKAKVHAQGGPPVDQQTLIYAGQHLTDNWRTLAQYKVKSDSTLVLMSHLCSC